MANLVARLRTLGPAASWQSAQVNGHPALILRLDGEVETVPAVRVDDGLQTTAVSR